MTEAYHHVYAVLVWGREEESIIWTGPIILDWTGLDYWNMEWSFPKQWSIHLGI